MVINANTRLIVYLLTVVLMMPINLGAQTTEEGAATGEKYSYSQDQLDSLLAPIALYPDTLLSQILMASTYPLEVVEADRWLKRNVNLSPDSLDAALREKPWDVSVKSLCHFPRVLGMMSDKLDDTHSLGDAFLGQEDQVMDTIQNLRARAKAAGHLAPTDNQKIVADDKYISIEPTAPDVIYVPAYDPCWVYGPWWYPVCSPRWFWWPDIVVGIGFFWGPPIFVGPAGPWCGFFWNRHRLFVNANRTFAFGRVGITRLHGGAEVWQHNPAHRRGIAYRDSATARQFGQMPRPGVEARRAFRGFAPEGRGAAPLSRPEGTPRQIRPEGAPGSPAQGRRGETQRLGRPPIQQQRPESSIVPRARPEGSGISRGTQRPEISVPHAPSFQQPRAASPLESFGHSGPEVRQQSERGSQSMGGFRDGGFSGAREGGQSRVGGGGGAHGGGRGR
jgi:hypothetical protein